MKTFRQFIKESTEDWYNSVEQIEQIIQKLNDNEINQLGYDIYDKYFEPAHFVGNMYKFSIYDIYEMLASLDYDELQNVYFMAMRNDTDTDSDTNRHVDDYDIGIDNTVQYSDSYDEYDDNDCDDYYDEDYCYENDMPQDIVQEGRFLRKNANLKRNKHQLKRRSQLMRDKIMNKRKNREIARKQRLLRKQNPRKYKIYTKTYNQAVDKGLHIPVTHI